MHGHRGNRPGIDTSYQHQARQKQERHSPHVYQEIHLRKMKILEIILEKVAFKADQQGVEKENRNKGDYLSFRKGGIYPLPIEEDTAAENEHENTCDLPR